MRESPNVTPGTGSRHTQPPNLCAKRFVPRPRPHPDAVVEEHVPDENADQLSPPEYEEELPETRPDMQAFVPEELQALPTELEHVDPDGDLDECDAEVVEEAAARLSALPEVLEAVGEARERTNSERASSGYGSFAPTPATVRGGNRNRAGSRDGGVGGRSGRIAASLAAQKKKSRRRGWLMPLSPTMERMKMHSELRLPRSCHTAV